VRFEQRLTLHVPVRLGRDLRRLAPDVLISHELGPRSLVAASHARRRGLPLVLWSYQSRASGGVGGRLRRTVRRRLLSRADAVVGMGVQAREVLVGWGVEPERIIDAPNACDHVTLLAGLSRPETRERAARLRAELAPEGRIALVAGRLVPLKGIEALLRTWSRLAPEIRRRWRLVFVGEGPLAPLIDGCGDASVCRAGAATPEEMAAWYAASDLQIFPTLGDVWGLVVNEGMTCGLPTLCSVHAGCADDMIEHGVNGLCFDPADPAGAAASLADALARDDLDGLGARARETAAAFSLDRLAAAFRTAVGLAVDRRAHAASVAA
jgi:glycosyltransferase involved in cell wall biosynthesis